jgi:two-component system, OmpR family, sensor histidine kinase KdpD
MDRMARITLARPRSRTLSILFAVLGPACATGLSLAIPHRTTTTAACVYLLGVVAAAVWGGFGSGLFAALLSFLGLDFFFTEPFKTLKVGREQDIVALPVFLAVAALVGALVALVVRERDRAGRASVEAGLLNRYTSRLLSEEPLKRLLEDAAAELVRVFHLTIAEIACVIGDERIAVQAGSMDEGGSGGPALSVSLGREGATLGSLSVRRGPGEPEFTDDERALLDALARQTALALDRERYDLEIRNAKLEAEASQMRAALFSSITHDLRTPLASIKASVSSLADPAVFHDDEQRGELLRTSLEESDRLNRLVGNLLDLARLRANALVPNTTVMPLDEVIEGVLARMRTTLQPFRIRTLFRADTPSVRVDPVQVDQVVTNILDNAVRFAPPGTEIQIAVHPWQSKVRARIADQGPGIDPADRKRVFEPFYQRDRGDGRGGSGLGLAIAQAIVGAHGGRIWAEGSPGGGTAIVFELPVPTQRRAAEKTA